MTQGADLRLLGVHQTGHAAVREALALERAQTLRCQAGATGGTQLALGTDQILDLGQEPGIDPAQRMDLLQGHADAEGVGDIEDALGAGLAHLQPDLLDAHRDPC